MYVCVRVYVCMSVISVGTDDTGMYVYMFYVCMYICMYVCVYGMSVISVGNHEI
jgi:hypothetical protein